MKRSTPGRTAAKLGNRSYLEEVLGLLWPPPNELVHGRQIGHAHQSQLQADLAIVPNLRRPRVVVPRIPRQAAAASVDIDRPTSGAARLRHAALTLSFRAGAGQALSSRVRIVAQRGAPAESITTYLSDALGQPVLPTFRVGSVRANRKPVLRLLSPSGETVGFAKVGISELTSELVRAEAQALDTVAGMKAKSFAAPGILHHGRWRGLEVLVQSPLPLADADAATDEQRQTAMLELGTGNHESATLELLTSPYWRRLRALIDDGDDETSRALARGLDHLAGGLSGAKLPFGAWHGDWTPWNMALSGGSLLVWDWERFDSEVPLGFDALHFYFQKIKSGRDADDAIQDVRSAAPMLLAPFGIEPQLSSTIMVMYAATLASRYARDYAAMGERTWTWQGSRMLQPLTRFVTEWPGPS
jgi:hypothetical protein